MDSRETAELQAFIPALTERWRNGCPAVCRRWTDMSLDTALTFETARFALCCATEDMREGTAASLDKRKPEFTGR